ncbi:hypothetical protein [Anaplasma marginale]|uniref:hypothetical protein n=1 Tax=Anaplasma marginale TaxID=770 RepID=UPI001F08CB28|nr:hypothetical protein [Anaplasma marginale]
MFSREISDGDTLLAGEMVGVDEGLVIQELSRPEELEKLQHELAKQVSKLAELGELKWLEQLETLETEELTARVQELKRRAARSREELKAFEEQKLGGKTPEEMKEKIKALDWLVKKLEEIGKLQKPEELEKVKESWMS